MSRQINNAGLAIIKQFEGCELKAYKCPAGVWTIGYGSTGAHVTPGLKITQERAEELLMQDLVRFEKGVSDLVKVELTDNQFSALVSLAFNIGLKNFGGSTLVRLLNKADYDGAASNFKKWIYAAGQRMRGLLKRREAERALHSTSSHPIIKR